MSLFGRDKNRLVTAEEAEYALRTTYTAVEGLAAHGYDLAAWLSTKDIALTWRRHP